MPRIHWPNVAAVAAIIIAAMLITVKNLDAGSATHLLNVSYDPTRESLRV